MSTFLSSVAVLLSTLALLCSGYTAYQVFTLQQTLNVASAGSRNATISTPKTSSSETSTVPPDTTSKSPEAPASSSSTTTPQSTASTGSAIKSGEFVQPSFGKKAEVELLSLKRIKDPETGNRDVVNLQMRIRRLATDGINPGESVGVYTTTARNPDTSETYKGVDVKRSTGSVDLSSLRPQASADAYVWLRIPEGVNSIDVFVPDTAAFKNVPVSN
ncbi:hypothetical protein DP113_21465 [Brasilonema octagenarum UFV-E1]|uniref:DUF4352 domain-containing protein n=1 Tax=Brasilonema sennae CENA114 TaxID=415709 RepID=A0A856MIY1_9CYAN|nr:hypothetical protein [Brasilonema sennae]QDL10130.1 hypothetical protein DP114_21540 [Brasilonema sennae CENA114]QDL16483.1 hypothetical protein DP113_21465 [Brasilonema octagenarum UFV-E1]